MVTGPAYRAAARFFFESPPRLDMAHRRRFVDQAHREAPEPLWQALAVLGAGIVGIWFVVSIVLGAA